MHFPLFQIFPSISENVSNLTLFPKRIFGFHPPKFLMTIFSHRLKIYNFTPPIFVKIVGLHFPYIGKIIISPTIFNYTLFFKFTYFTCFRFPNSPYFDHDMHLCITQCMYWTPLQEDAGPSIPLNPKSMMHIVYFLSIFPQNS